MEFIDLKSQYKLLEKEINENIGDVLNNTEFILGKYTELFEARLEEYLGVKHAVTCSDGTAALQLIFMANGIGKGCAVFCPAMTFIASVEPAVMLGATPVFCDIDEKTYNIDPESLERQIQNVAREGMLKPAAIVGVDFLGNPADFDALQSIAERYHLLLLEDAAQGMGASFRGRKCGTLGDIAATSFFPSKPLGCYGDGGAVFTNDDETDTVLRSLRVHGKGKNKYDNIRIGINSRLDTLQAAVLLPKLGILSEEIKKRQEIARIYDEALKSKYKIPYVREGNVSSYAQYIVMTESQEHREKCLQRLKSQNIPSIMYYPNPLHKLPVFKGINHYGEQFPVAENYSTCSFGIPFSPYLTRSDQNRVIECLMEA